MVGRVILLIAAFVVAGLGALLVFLYAREADNRAEARFESVEVLVATQDIAAGTRVSEAQQAGSFELVARPVGALPDGALSDTVGVEELVLVGPMLRNEVLSSGNLGDQAAQGGLVIDDGRLAVSFTLGDPNRVAGFVAPGSRVAVFLTTSSAQTQQTDPATGETALVAGGQTTRLLLPDVQVIAVGASTTQAVTTTAPDGQQQTTETNLSLLTLALTQREAEQMVLGQSLGELYLGLLTDTSDVQPGSGVDAGSLFGAVP